MLRSRNLSLCLQLNLNIFNCIITIALFRFVLKTLIIITITWKNVTNLIYLEL